MAQSKGGLVFIIREFRNPKTGRVQSYSVQHCPSVAAARKILRRAAGLKGKGVLDCVEQQLVELRKYGQFWIEPTLSRKFRGRPRKFHVGGHYTTPKKRY